MAAITQRPEANAGCGCGDSAAERTTLKIELCKSEGGCATGRVWRSSASSWETEGGFGFIRGWRFGPPDWQQALQQ